MFKNMTKNLRSLLKNFGPKLGFKRFDLYLFALFLTIQAVLVGVSVYTGTIQFNYMFVNNYYIQLILVFLTCITIFIFTFKDYAKKNLNLSLFIFYIVCTALFTWNILGINASLETITNRALFSISNFIFILIFIILLNSVISKYDFPMTINWTEFYLEAMSHFKRNLGIFFGLALITSILSFYNKSFIYPISFILVIDSVYILKALMANIRR